MLQGQLRVTEESEEDIASELCASDTTNVRNAKCCQATSGYGEWQLRAERAVKAIRSSLDPEG